MANDCCGTLKVVAKDIKTLERIKNILGYEDEEYFISRCRSVDSDGEPYKDGDFFVQDFYVDGAWNCGRFFDTTEDETKLLIKRYENTKGGTECCLKPIYGTAHLTNLCELAKKLDFGCELFSTEPGMVFCEHISVNHLGEFGCNETGYYEERFAEDENGNPDYSKDPEVICELENFNEFGYADEIYG